MDKKRLIFIIIFIVAVLGLGYLMYRVFFASEETITPGGIKQTGSKDTLPTTNEKQLPTTGGIATGETVRPGTTDTTGVLPRAGVRQVTSIVNSAVVSPAINKNGEVNYYNSSDGKFYTVMADGSTKPLSDQVFFNISRAVWSPNKNEAVIEYPDGANIFYNFDTGVQTTLSKHWEDFSFSAESDQIAAKSIGLSAENRWIVTSDANGENVNLIEPLGDNAEKVIVDWSPNKQIIGISLTGEPVGADRQEILFIGQNGENFNSMIVEGRGFESQWSPKGEKILYSVYSSRSQYKPELWVADANVGNLGANRKLIGLNTWSNKCAFLDEQTVYCATPKEMPIGSGFSRELTSNLDYNIIKVDLKTGSQSIIQMNESHKIDQIFISENKGQLYFTDKFLTGIFSISI